MINLASQFMANLSQFQISCMVLLKSFVTECQSICFGLAFSFYKLVITHKWTMEPFWFVWNPWEPWSAPSWVSKCSQKNRKSRQGVRGQHSASQFLALSKPWPEYLLSWSTLSCGISEPDKSALSVKSKRCSVISAKISKWKCRSQQDDIWNLEI